MKLSGKAMEEVKEKLRSNGRFEETVTGGSRSRIFCYAETDSIVFKIALKLERTYTNLIKPLTAGLFGLTCRARYY
jgi:hypothetical protein